MLAQYVDVSDWTPEQWLAACILAFIIVTVLVVMHRTVKIFQLAGKSKYEPNLRPLRRARSQSKSKNPEENAE